MLLKDIITTKKDSNKIAIRFKEKSISYKELYNLSKKCADKILNLGINTENVGIFLPNSISYAIAYFTIALLDKVIVPIGIQSKQAEVKSTIEYCRLELIITCTKNKEVLKNYLIDFKYGVIVLSLEDMAFDRLGLCEEEFVSQKVCNIKEEDDVILMLHTSGTTSNPKRVMLTHKNLFTNIKSIIHSLKLTEHDKTLISLPMYLASGNTSQFLTHLYLGASIVIMDGVFIPNNFFRIVQSEGITNFTCVPPILFLLLDYKRKMEYDISSLKFICFGGASTPSEKILKVLKEFPSVNFVQMYGQTEATTRITHLLPEYIVDKVNSVGKPIPNVEVRIVDENARDVEVGEIGEIIVKGNNVMKGYYRREKETERTIKDGWLYTGDLGKYDDDSFIYIVGRNKNVIISGGMNIYPEEIEELLLCNEAVENVCVVGEKHSIMGEVPVAKIILKSNNKFVSEGDIKNYCMDKLANYKVPDRIIFVDELLLTASKKIRRY